MSPQQAELVGWMVESQFRSYRRQQLIQSGGVSQQDFSEMILELSTRRSLHLMRQTSRGSMLPNGRNSRAWAVKETGSPAGLDSRSQGTEAERQEWKSCQSFSGQASPSCVASPTPRTRGPCWYWGQPCLLGSTLSWSLETKGIKTETKWWRYSYFRKCSFK